MLLDCMDFYETEPAFLSKEICIDDLNLHEAELVVKAHEKEIYLVDDKYIMAKIHRDNNCTYPFSKIDFLTHKLQEIIYPECVPKIHFGYFNTPNKPMFILERVPLDKLHIAYNIKRQKYHQANNETYYYKGDFFKLDEQNNIDELAKKHDIKVTNMQHDYADLLDKYGIAFDSSHVNITWKENIPVSLEVHKGQRDYLFNIKRCKEYLRGLPDDFMFKNDGLLIIERLTELTL